jgi:hypothetical protein
MVSVIQSEWHRGLRAWRFWATMALTLSIFLASVFQYAPLGVSAPPIPHYINFFSMTLAFLGSYLFALWPVAIPLLAALPAGDSLAVDRRRGADALAITRVGWARYLWGKLVGNALLAVAAVAVPMAVAAAAAVARFPAALPPFLGWVYNASLPYRVKQSGVFGDQYHPAFQAHFFWATPGLYVIVACLMALWATVALASVSIAASVWVRVSLVTLAIPVGLFWVGNFVSQGMASPLIPSVYAGAYLYWPTRMDPPSWGALALYWALPALATVGVLAWMGLRRREWPSSSMGQ